MRVITDTTNLGEWKTRDRGWINLPYQLGLMVGLIIGKGKGEKVEVGIGGRVYKKPVYRTQQGQVRER